MANISLLLMTTLKTKIKRACEKLFSGFALKHTLLCCGLFFLSFCLIFPAGCFSKDINVDRCANYYSEIAKKHTRNLGPKRLSGLLVEPKDGNKNKMRQDTDNAITELWGVFKGHNATFAPVINANRDNDVFFVDKEYSNESLPLVYTNIGQSAEPYHYTKTGEIVDYKFQSSPLALMFPSFNKGMHESIHIYISQAQAERKLLAMGKEVNLDSLKSLLTEKVQMSINGNIYNCTIDNIYLDNFEHNYKFSDFNYYYGTDVGTVIGDFVFVIFYAVKADKLPPESSLKRESLYIMSEYAYRNKFFLKYAKDSYSYGDYSFKYSTYNLVPDFYLDESILQNSLTTHKLNILCILLCVLSISIFVFSMFLVYIRKLFKQPVSLSCLIVSSALPYLLFKLIYFIWKNGLFYSTFSLIFEIIMFIVLAISLMVVNCFGRVLRVESKNVS